MIKARVKTVKVLLTSSTERRPAWHLTYILVSISSRQRVKASPRLLFARLLSLFLFLASSDNVFLGFFITSAMMSIQRILR